MGKIIWTSAMIATILAFMVFGGNMVLSFKHRLLPQSGVSDPDALKNENAALRVELEKIISIKNEVDSFKPDSVSALVYSTYPWSGKSQITVNAGSSQGIEEKMPVLSHGLLVGIIEQVYKNYSTVKTVFDRTFEIPVKIGDKAINGLFKGGSNPSVELIPKEADVKAGSGVYSASLELPFGLPLGELKDVQKDQGDAWESARLDIPYNLDNIQTVSIIKNYGK